MYMPKDPGQQAHTGSSQPHTVRNLQGLEAALFLEEDEEEVKRHKLVWFMK